MTYLPNKFKSIISVDPGRYFNDLAKAYAENDQKRLAKLRVSLQAFHNEPLILAKEKIQALHKAQIQGFAVSTDFPKLVSDAYNVTVAEQNYDLGYEAAYLNVPVSASEDSWDIYDVQDGLTFNLIPEGGRIQVDKMSGSILTCHTDFYGGAIGWTYKMITKRKIAAMLSIANIFRNRFFTNKASNMYLLLAAGAAAAVALYGAVTWQGSGADNQLQRDILTINKAVYNLALRCKDKGYGNTANIPLIGYANLFDQSRIEAAMGVTTQALAAAGKSGQIVRRPIQWIYTLDTSIVSGSPFIMIPKNKTQSANPMAPTTFTAPLDPLTLNTLQAVWAEYGAGIGDYDVFETLTLG